MSLTSRTSDTHNHLARRVGKKHNSLHTVTPAHRVDDPEHPRQKVPSPFSPIQFSTSSETTESAYKPIFRF